MSIEQGEAAKGRRGLAALTQERRREIASLGGKSRRPESRAFSQSRDLAVEAGRKGGRAAKWGKPPKG